MENRSHILMLTQLMGFLILLSLVMPGMPAYADEAKQVEIISEEFSFSPKKIEVQADQELHITLANHGALAHNITFKDKAVATDTIQGDEKTTTTVTFSEPGQYEFICSVPGHANAGMKGQVVVNN